MAKRKKIAASVAKEVLIRSGRRCCLCLGLKNDFNIKDGQIAHLDRNRSNDNIDNLAFLCLEHHAQYDTSRSISRGFSSPTNLGM